MSESVVFLVNVLNVIIAAVLFLVSFNTYKSYKLHIFKKAWLLITLGSALWLVGHVAMLLGSRGILHYALFTVFIILLALALSMLSKAAKTLGV